MVFAAIAVVIAAYFIGSVNFAVIFAKAFLKKDVRNLGSGNAGATNVMRTAGFLPGILTFVCDALKGFVASYLGKLVFGLVMSSGANWLHPIYGAYLCRYKRGHIRCVLPNGNYTRALRLCACAAYN